MISPQYVDGLEQRIKELAHERDELASQLKTSRRDYEVMNKFREGAEAERDALAAHKMAVHKLTGLPASVGVCEPIEGFAERPQDLVPAVRDMALRIKDLETERDAPATSLAKRDARVAAEALDELASVLSLSADNTRENGYMVAADAMQDAADYALTKAEIRRQAGGDA